MGWVEGLQTCVRHGEEEKAMTLFRCSQAHVTEHVDGSSQRSAPLFLNESPFYIVILKKRCARLETPHVDVSSLSDSDARLPLRFLLCDSFPCFPTAVNMGNILGSGLFIFFWLIATRLFTS